MSLNERELSLNKKQVFEERFLVYFNLQTKMEKQSKQMAVTKKKLMSNI